MRAGDEATGTMGDAVSSRPASQAASLWERSAVHVAALVLYGALALLPLLGQEVDLANREARHAEIAREMAASDNYVVPMLCGEVYRDKGPLFNWTVALLFRLTGRVDYFVARLPSALSAVAVMVGIYLLGRRWLSARAGLLAVVIWATSFVVAVWARCCRTDMLMTCLLLFAVVLADGAATAASRGRRAGLWLAACALAGLAALSKGPHPLLFFAFAAVLLWRARRGRWGPPVPLIVLALGVFAALIGGWALAAERAHPGYLALLTGHQLGEGLSQHAEPPYYYFVHVLLQTAPWGLFAAGAGWWTVRRWCRRGLDAAAVAPLVFAALLVLHTLVTNKRIHYMLPALPWWALWLGGFMAEAARPPAGRETVEGWPPAGAFQWPLLLILLVLTVAGLAGPFAWMKRVKVGVGVAAAVCVPLAALAAWGVAALARGRAARALALLCAAAALISVAWFPLWIRYAARPSKDVLAANELVRAVAAGVPLAAYGLQDEHLYFKLNRAVLFARDPGELRAFLALPGPRCLITRADLASEARGLSARPLRQLLAWETQYRPGVLLCAEP